MNDENDQLLYADDSQYINEISQKLAKIRQNLGIEIYEQDQYQTPQSDYSQKGASHKDHNTFGKEQKHTDSKCKDVLPLIPDDEPGSSPKRDIRISNQSLKDASEIKEENSQFPQQISFLQNKLEALKQICNMASAIKTPARETRRPSSSARTHI